MEDFTDKGDEAVSQCNWNHSRERIFFFGGGTREEKVDLIAWKTDIDREAVSRAQLVAPRGSRPGASGRSMRLRELGAASASALLCRVLSPLSQLLLVSLTLLSYLQSSDPFIW